MCFVHPVVELHLKSITLIHKSGQGQVLGFTRSLTPLEKFRPIISVSVEVCQLVGFAAGGLAAAAAVLR
jgi:hypothetical protein